MSDYLALPSVKSIYFRDSNYIYKMIGSQPIFRDPIHLENVDKSWVKSLSKEDRIKRGKSGREWSIEHGFTHKGMGDAAINAIDTCFKEFVPRSKFQIIDTVEKPIKYEEGILI